MGMTARFKYEIYLIKEIKNTIANKHLKGDSK
jgi:hypothetical protein